MESQNSEIEKDQAEVVRIGETFPLFNPTRTYKERGPGTTPGVYDILSDIGLSSDILPTFPLHLRAFSARVGKERAITPYSLKEGYAVTQEDTNYELRKQKVQKIREESPGLLPSDVALLILGAGNDDESEMQKAGLILKDEGRQNEKSPYIWNKDYLGELARLRFQVTISTDTRKLQFEAMPMTESLEADHFGMDGLSFEDFYPTDIGPLVSKPNEIIRPGLKLALPYDMDKLQSITGKFFFDKPHLPKE